MTLNIPEIISASNDELIGIFKDIHQHPEIGFEENRTSRIIQSKLE